MIADLKKENFDLKLRLYHLEAAMQKQVNIEMLEQEVSHEESKSKLPESFFIFNFFCVYVFCRTIGWPWTFKKRTSLSVHWNGRSTGKERAHGPSEHRPHILMMPYLRRNLPRPATIRHLQHHRKHLDWHLVVIMEERVWSPSILTNLWIKYWTPSKVYISCHLGRRGGTTIPVKEKFLVGWTKLWMITALTMVMMMMRVIKTSVRCEMTKFTA